MAHICDFGREQIKRIYPFKGRRLTALSFEKIITLLSAAKVAFII
jgi:hypothetical protein